MFRWLSKLILKIAGWKIAPNVPAEVRRCVIIAAPHTSNWDYIFTLCSMSVLGVKIRYTIKKEWMRPPVGWFVRATGGIGIDRSPKKPGEPRPSTVESIVQLFRDNQELCVIIPAEGSRSLRTEWKTGFYHVAKEAGVPIALGYLDYANKIAGIGGIIHPSGDLDEDMTEIMRFYEPIKGRFPEKFSLDVRYWPPKSTENPSAEPENPPNPS